MKRIAYGYGRKQADFAHTKYDHIFLEDDKSRAVLAETIRDFFYSGHGDVMVLVSDDDLPTRGPFRDVLAAKGATIEVHDIPGKKSVGRPSGFEPTKAQDIECRRIWNTPYYRDHAAGLVSQEVGYKVSKYQLTRRYGKGALDNE